MNVPVDIIVGLANVLGVGHDLKAEGVVRCALERLKGDRGYHLEVFEENPGRWDFCSFHESYAEAQQLRAQLADRFERRYRVVELLRRVLP